MSSKSNQPSREQQRTKANCSREIRSSAETLKDKRNPNDTFSDHFKAWEVGCILVTDAQALVVDKNAPIGQVLLHCCKRYNKESSFFYLTGYTVSKSDQVKIWKFLFRQMIETMFIRQKCFSLSVNCWWNCF